MNECVKCGRCCSHLRIGDEKSGLTLFADEIHLFPMEKVRPHYGKGVSKPSIIFTYQYTENICIHLKDNMCTIYDSRPLMCRSFPVQLGVNGIRFSPGCRAVLDIIPRSKVMNNDLPEVKAAMEMGERLLEFYRDLGENELKWKYNLISEAWEST